jgi:sirohydrochlorin cobaltochelatase
MPPVVVLAMHGAPPTDFPPQELGEFFALHARVEASAGGGPPEVTDRYHILEKRMRRWPRTEENDPFYSGSHSLARELEKATGFHVQIGFNEYCAPSLEEAFDHAVAAGADRVLVVTPMMTRGGAHSESDIPAAIERARRRHPAAKFHYAWPFSEADVASFLATHIERNLARAGWADIPPTGT